MTKKTAIVAVVLVCLLAAWIFAEKKAANSVRPPAGGTNLVAFLDAQPQPNQIRSFIHNGKVYVEVIGKPSISPLSLPSGSPAYIFDETGAFLDWCRDLGDNPSFVKKWGGFSNATPMSVEQAKQLVKTNGLTGRTRTVFRTNGVSNFPPERSQPCAVMPAAESEASRHAIISPLAKTTSICPCQTTGTGRTSHDR